MSRAVPADKRLHHVPVTWWPVTTCGLDVKMFNLWDAVDIDTSAPAREFTAHRGTSDRSRVTCQACLAVLDEASASAGDR